MADSPDNKMDRKVSGGTKTAHYGAGVELPQFSPLLAPMQYEEVQAMAEEAGILDATSGALDPYIFVGDGVDVEGGYETPFEKSLPLLFQFEKSRVSALGARDLLKAQAALDELSVSRQKSSLNLDLQLRHLDSSSQTLSSLESELQTQLHSSNALAGQKGVAALVTLQTSIRSAKLATRQQVKTEKKPLKQLRSALARELLRTWIIYLTVALVDSAIVYFALSYLVDTNFWEGVAFTAPAILLQVTLPHLLGKTWSGLFTKKGTENKSITKAKDRGLGSQLLVSLLLLLWLGLVFTLTVARSNFVKKSLEGRSDQMPRYWLAMFLVALVLVGLGLWVALTVARDNPDVRNALRKKLAEIRPDAQMRIREHRAVFSKDKNTLRKLFVARLVALRFERAVIATKAELDRLSKAIETQEAANANLELEISHFENQVLSEYPLYAKLWYRRSLANKFGDPDFTTRVTK